MAEDLQLTTLRQGSNRKILLLNSRLGPVSNEFYRVGFDPSIGHLTRMLEDLRALYGCIPDEEKTDARERAYEDAYQSLLRMREYLDSVADAEQ